MIGALHVSLEALARNARTLRDLVAPSKAAFVVKGNAYGHGLIAAARALEPFAHRLCVYSLDEAAALRDAGIASSILVMGPIESAHLDEAFARNVEIALWNTGPYLAAAARVANKRRGRFRVHVKIDTGTARLGLTPADAVDAIEDYARMPEIEIAGVFSHLAAAEELDTAFTFAQLERFQHVLRAVHSSLDAKGVRPLRHIASSAAAMLWPQMRLDMARIGIAAYGLWPSAQIRSAAGGERIELQPALSFTSKLAAIRHVDAGTPVGYGGAYRAEKPTRIGTVPLGYADGIPRLLSNRGEMLVSGARCPIAGRVCMNMTMIDLENAPDAVPGDAVTLTGSQDSERVEADDWARWAQTIAYEIVARLPAHLPRSFDREQTA